MRKIAKYIIRLLPLGLRSKLLLALVWAHKDRYGERVLEQTQGKVQRGPLRGLAGLGKSNWSGNQDLPAKIFGTYEDQLLPFIFPPDTIWDQAIIVGAGDGYWAVGLKYSRKADLVVAFEMSERSREQVTQLANSNKCDLEIRGLAENAELTLLAKSSKGKTLFLFDIEGAEYREINDDFLRAAGDCHIIIELHGHDEELKSAFMASLDITHDVKIVSRESYSTRSQFNPLLTSIVEHEALLLLSEGRTSIQQQWAICTPREGKF